MRFEDEWSANEDCLVQEADSLGELLGRMRGVFSPLLIGDPEWEALMTCARDLPATLAGFPLWIGFPVDDSRPAVSLDVSMLGGTRSATAMRQGARRSEAGPSLTGAAVSLLDETARENSPVRHVAGDRALLHCDIDAARREPVRASVSLYPIRSKLAGDDVGQGLQDFKVVLDALSAATGREPDGALRKRIKHVFSALGAGARIGAVSASLPAAGELRLTVLGFCGTQSMLDFLRRAGWREEGSDTARAVARLEAKGALSGMRLGVRFDVTAAGVERCPELHIFSTDTIYDDTGWFKGKRWWSQLIDGLREEGFASPEKLPELERWSFAAKPLFGRSGLLLLLQRIHHFSFVLDGDGMRQINAHVFLLLTRWTGGRNSG